MRKLKDLTIEEQLDIIRDATIKKDYHENICSRYNIGRETLKSLLKNTKRDPNYMRKKNEKAKLKLTAANIITEKLEQ